jgi:Mg-chelatase subunit ChlD
MKNKSAADAFGVCPITNEPFVDPVVDHEGNTYEKKAIEAWLEQNSTSPITRNPLTLDQLFPNRALKNLIESQGEEGSVKSANTSPTVSDDEPDIENQEALMEIAKSARVQSMISGPDGRGAVKVVVPEENSDHRLPASIICVIDESYSMDGAATTQEDQEGNSGLSLLDIVKHATKTVIEILGPEDCLAIITYADNATLRMPFLKMTRANKNKATRVVNEFKTRGSTNLWDGLHQAMELANKMTQTTDVFLLTDGIPNIHPPRGELETFSRYKAKGAKCNYRISTFGFGYSLDSKLLNDLAIEGDGQFFFIPDSSFVGTVFINATSFVVSTALGKSTLMFEGNGSAKVLTNEEEASKAPQERMKVLPSLSFGHNFDLIVKKKDYGDSVTWDAPVHSIDWDVPRLRFAMVELIRRAENRFFKKEANALKTAQDEITELVAEFDLALAQPVNPESQSHTILKALREDLTGQITEAYSREDWHTKWGKHYLLSLARAHELQRCTNFKDPGLQIYATTKFGMIRDDAEEIFCGIPPPTPSRRVDSRRYQPVASMSTYYNAAAGCLARGNVRLADGRYVPVSSVAPGDILQIGSRTAKVRCVVTTECDNGVEELVELDGGVLVTPWHPIRKKGSTKWEFPANLGEIKPYTCKMVYNFVLDGDCAILLGPYEAITLGHGISNDAVAKHEYFGTNKVIEELQLMYGWNQGRVHLGTNPGRRDPATGQVNGFVQNVEIAEESNADSKSIQGTQVFRSALLSA